MSVADEIKTRLDIVDVISDTVTLKKSGRNFTGFCPFHSNTKTPSFVVFSETQSWRCFGACADGGDIFSFIMKREGYDFKEALDLLARRAGITLKPAGPQASKQEAHRRKLVELNAAAADYFHKLLTTSTAGANVRAYLTERDLTTETMTIFQLGYALDQWDALKNHLIERGYSPAEIVAAGLIVERDDGQPGYDRFRKRFIIPIRDPRGRVIGFGGRALAANQVPKYINSPQTILFDKSAALYGIDLARKAIRQSGQVVIVEGYMDVIQAHQRGARNVVAQMGTALTEAQLKHVASLANKIILALDSDAAGSAATVRGLSLARQSLPKRARATSTSRGIEYEAHIAQEIYIAALPAGQDPDDVLRKGLNVWEELIAKAIPALDFYEKLILQRGDLTTAQGKSFVVHELIPIYREIKDNIEKVARVGKLARKTGLSERLLEAELRSNSAPSRPPSRRRQPVQPSEPLEKKKITTTPGQKSNRDEEYCLALILAHPTVLAVINESLEEQGLTSLTVNDFKQGENKNIFKALQLWTASKTPTIELLMDMVDDQLEQRLIAVLDRWHRRPPVPQEDAGRDLRNTILRLRLKQITEQMAELKLLQYEAKENKNIAEVRHYTEMGRTCSKQRKKLHDATDAFSLMGRRRTEANL